MKKFFTLIVGALLALSANAQTAVPLSGDGWRCDFVATSPQVSATYNYKNAYGSVDLISEAINVADYPSYELVLADDAPYSDLQFYVKYDTESASGSQGWSGNFSSASPSAFVPEGAVKIESIQMQACNKENLGNVTIKSFYLIDKDGNKVATTLGQPASWSAPLIASSGTATWKDGQWGRLLTTLPADLSSQIITVNSETAFPTEQVNLVIKTTKTPDGLYKQLPAGEKVLSRTIEASEGTITEISLQYAGAAESLPLSLNISSITVQDYVSPEYSTTPVDITYSSESGFFTAEQFNGLSLDSKVDITYNTVGSDGYVGWGAMAIASNSDQNAEGAVKYNSDFGIKTEGNNVVSCKLSDIADILNTSYDATTGKYGAYWCIWGFGDGKCTNSRVSLKVYDCTNSKAAKFAAKADEAVTPATKTPLYVIGNVNGKNGNGWTPNEAVATLEYDATNDVYTGTITVDDNSAGNGWFGVSTTLGTSSDDWTGFNAGRLSVGKNWGVLNETASLQAQGTDASFQFPAGSYTVTISLTNNTALITSDAAGINSVSTASASDKVYKVVSNGSILIVKNGVRYRANGIVGGPIPLPTQR